MNKTKVNEIIKFNFNKNFQNKWFIIFNILTLIGVIVVLNWGNISLLFKSSNEAIKIEVIDKYNLVYDEFEQLILNDKSDEIEENEKLYEITKIVENNYTSENIPKDVILIEVIPNEAQEFEVSIISKEGISGNRYLEITEKLKKIRNEKLRNKYKMTEEELDILQSDLKVNRIMLAVNAENSDLKELITLFSSALTYFITVLIFSKIANEVSSEKQSKSIEYILTTVSEREYLFAKIFSNIAILIIQGILLIVYYLIAVLLSNLINITIVDVQLNSTGNLFAIDGDVVIYICMLILFNVLNIILFAIIQATLSAKTTSTAEAGNTVSLLASIMMILYLFTNVVITPYSKVNMLVYIVSFIPGISAYFIPAMMVVGQANVIQIVGALLILILSINFVFNKCAENFKNGILDYTKTKKTRKNEKSFEDMQKEFLTKRKMKNVGFVIGMALILYIGIQNLLAILLNMIFSTLVGNVFTETDINLILQMLLQIISIGIAYSFIAMYLPEKNMEIDEKVKKPKNQLIERDKDEDLEQKEEKTALEDRTTLKKNKLKIIYKSVIIIFAIQLIIGAIYSIIELDYDVTDTLNINSEVGLLTKILTIVTIAVVPAIFEELLFRKAIIDFLSVHGKKFALLFSAILFGIAHMNLSQGLFAFIIGIILGAIYIYTQDIKVTMTIHFINNLLGALELILQEEFAVVLFTIIFVSSLYIFIEIILKIFQKDGRKQIKNLFNIKVSLKNIKNKYIYIFYDYNFDIAILLIFVISIATEKVLRLM